MDISKQFTFTDLMAYFFPGACATAGIYFIALIPRGPTALKTLSFDITTGIAFLILSYIVGVISSGFSHSIVKRFEKCRHYRDPKLSLPLDLFPDEVMQAFCEVYGVKLEDTSKWTKNHFWICRSCVKMKSPALIQIADRQSDLSLFRRNLVFPLLVWTSVGIGWGMSYIGSGDTSSGMALIIITLLASFLSIETTIQRMHNSELIEVRETLIGFLVGYKLGVFRELDKSRLTDIQS